jgi:hypothetical protein
VAGLSKRLPAGFASRVVGTVCKVAVIVRVADTSAGDIVVDEVAGTAEVAGTVAAGGAGRCHRRVGSLFARTETAYYVADTVGTAANGHDDHYFASAESLKMLWIPGLPVLEAVHAADIDGCLALLVRDQHYLDMRIAHLVWATAAAVAEDSNYYKQPHFEEMLADEILVSVPVVVAAACGCCEEMTVSLSEMRTGKILVYF